MSKNVRFARKHTRKMHATKLQYIYIRQSKMCRPIIQTTTYFGEKERKKEGHTIQSKQSGVPIVSHE